MVLHIEVLNLKVQSTDKLVKRKISLLALDPQGVQPAAGKGYRQLVKLKEGVEKDKAKETREQQAHQQKARQCQHPQHQFTSVFNRTPAKTPIPGDCADHTSS